MTMRTIPDITVRDSTKEKPERLDFIVKWGLIKVSSLYGMSKDWLPTSVKNNHINVI